jgi:hypothetical protein
VLELGFEWGYEFGLEMGFKFSCKLFVPVVIIFPELKWYLFTMIEWIHKMEMASNFSDFGKLFACFCQQCCPTL